MYEGVIAFGYSTDTYDSEGAATSPPPATPVTLGREQLETAFAPFRGRFEQIPPAVSAKKIDGQKAYELARKQLPVELKAVSIEVYALDLLSLAVDDGICTATVRVHCSAGTYVRSIAHDVGHALGCGAFLKSLRRTASGDFKIEAARTLDDLATLAEAGRLREAIIPAAQLLPDFPTELVDAITVGQIRNGRDFRVSPFVPRKDARYVKAINAEGDLVAIGEARLPLVYHPVLVL